MDEVEARMRAIWRKDPPDLLNYPGPFAFKRDYCKDEEETEPPTGLVETWVIDFLNRDGTLVHESLKGLGLVPCFHRTMAKLPRTTQVTVTDAEPTVIQGHSAKSEPKNGMDSDRSDYLWAKPINPLESEEPTKGLMHNWVSDCTNVGGTVTHDHLRFTGAVPGSTP